jgi:drug/metabolite transporter (DMT)-like permease
VRLLWRPRRRYVVKSLIPVFTVAISWLVQGAQYSPATLFTLVPVVLGVALAAWSDMELTAVGLGAALASTLLQTFLNLSVKRAIEESKLGGVQAHLLMVGVASALLVVPTALADPAWLSRLSAAFATAEGRRLIGLSAFAYQLEYALSFLLTGLFRPLTFAVADIARRLLIIGVGAVMFSKPLSALNVLGIAICFGGVAAYTALSQGANKSKSA